MVAKLLAPLNALYSIDLIPSGNTKVVKLVQLAKAISRICVIELGRVTFTTVLQE